MVARDNSGRVSTARVYLHEKDNPSGGHDKSRFVRSPANLLSVDGGRFQHTDPSTGCRRSYQAVGFTLVLSERRVRSP